MGVSLGRVVRLLARASLPPAPLSPKCVSRAQSSKHREEKNTWHQRSHQWSHQRSQWLHQKAIFGSDDCRPWS